LVAWSALPDLSPPNPWASTTAGAGVCSGKYRSASRSTRVASVAVAGPPGIVSDSGACEAEAVGATINPHRINAEISAIVRRGKLTAPL